MKNSWHSVLGILEHLHPDEDERPFNPSASSHETPMEVDREVDVPLLALPPSALPPPAPLFDAGPDLLLSDTSLPRTKTFLVQFWRLTACTGNSQ